MLHSLQYVLGGLKDPSHALTCLILSALILNFGVCFYRKTLIIFSLGLGTQLDTRIFNFLTLVQHFWPRPNLQIKMAYRFMHISLSTPLKQQVQLPHIYWSQELVPSYTPLPIKQSPNHILILILVWQKINTPVASLIFENNPL